MGEYLTGVRTNYSWATTRFRIRHALLDSRIIGASYVAVRPAYRDQLITSSTRLVIDGFPRSANSFARYAIHVSQGDASMLAGHNHSSAFVIRAASQGIPSVVVVRRPDDAVASLIQSSAVPPWAAFAAYSRFHRNIEQAIDSILVVPFDLVVNDFAAVIDRINERFGLRLVPFTDGPTMRARISALLEESNRGLSGGVVDERTVARPSEQRKTTATVLGELSRRDRRASENAREVYGLLMGQPDADVNWP